MPNYAQEIADNGQRVITFLIYLNDDYEGGETAFPEMGISHKGKTGEGLYFVNSLPDGSADIRTLHAGKPPTSNQKWIVSQFVRNRPESSFRKTSTNAFCSTSSESACTFSILRHVLYIALEYLLYKVC
jgi:hypothetical protein